MEASDDDKPAGVNPFPEECARLWRLPVGGSAVPYGFEFPTLDRAQAAVDGYVEAVPVSWLGRPATLLVNEDGQAFNLPPNEAASMVLAVHELAVAAREANDPSRPLTPFVEAFFGMSPTAILGPALLWLGPVPPEARI